MSGLGDRATASVAGGSFSTAVNGQPTTLSGSPAVQVYKKGSSTPSSSGVTLNVDVNSIVGLNTWVVDTNNAFYATGLDFDVVISAGTVGGISQIGKVVGHFSLGLGNVSNIASNATAATNLNKGTNATAIGTVNSGSTTTSVTTSALSIAGAAATGVVANQFSGRTVVFAGDTTTAGLRDAQASITASSASNTPTLTVGTLPATPVSGDVFVLV